MKSLYPTLIAILFCISNTQAGVFEFPFVDDYDQEKVLYWKLDQEGQERAEGSLQVWDEGMRGPYLVRDSVLKFYKGDNVNWELREVNRINKKDIVYRLISSGVNRWTFESEVFPEVICDTGTFYPKAKEIHRLVWIQDTETKATLFLEYQTCDERTGDFPTQWICDPVLSQPYFLMKQQAKRKLL